jgi:hypothetical protein
MRSSILAIIISAAIAAPVLAQTPARPGRAARGDRLGPAEILRVLDGYALVQAQEALQLNDAQYGTFVTRLRKLQETRRRHLQGRNQILAELRRLVGPQAGEPASDAAVREQIEALRTHDEKAATELRQAYDAIDQALDTSQQARFRLFEESLERRKLDLIMRARQGARGGS